MVFWRDRIIHSQWGRAGRANVAWRLIQKMWKDKLRSWVNLGQLEVSVWFWATCIYSSMGDYIWRITIICLRFEHFLFMVLLEGFIFYRCIPAFATRTSSSNDGCLAVFLTIPCSRLFKCTRIYGMMIHTFASFWLKSGPFGPMMWKGRTLVFLLKNQKWWVRKDLGIRIFATIEAKIMGS